MKYEKGISAFERNIKPVAAKKAELELGPQNINMFVPMQSKGEFVDGTPVNTLMVKTRGEVCSEWFDGGLKAGALGSAYTAYLYAILAFIGVLLFYNINIYVSAVFAYLAGVCWSKLLTSYAWNAVWFRGKSLISTK